jgi:putative NADPH-quinone reductase
VTDGVRCLVVHAHPDPASFSAAVRDTAVSALERAGHQVRSIDLYAEQFDPVLSAAEREVYNEADPVLDDQVRAHGEHVRWAEVLVFVYPTWWAGPPAILKGWLDRVLVSGVAFRHVPVRGGHRVEPCLQHVRAIVGISTYGSPRWLSFVVADAGRRMLVRALWLCTRRRTKRVWLGLYGVDTSSPEARQAFLDRVTQRLHRL